MTFKRICQAFPSAHVTAIHHCGESSSPLTRPSLSKQERDIQIRGNEVNLSLLSANIISWPNSCQNLKNQAENNNL